MFDIVFYPSRVDCNLSEQNLVFANTCEVSFFAVARQIAPFTDKVDAPASPALFLPYVEPSKRRRSSNLRLKINSVEIRLIIRMCLRLTPTGV